MALLIPKGNAATRQLDSTFQGQIARARNGAAVLAPRSIQAAVCERAGSRTAQTHQPDVYFLALSHLQWRLQVKGSGYDDLCSSPFPPATFLRKLRRIHVRACVNVCNKEAVFTPCDHMLSSSRRGSSSRLRRGRSVSRSRSAYPAACARGSERDLSALDDGSFRDKRSVVEKASTNIPNSVPKSQQGPSKTRKDRSALATGNQEDAAFLREKIKREGPENVVIEAVVGGATELLRILGVGRR
jgi:hypothetical protein